MNRIGEEYVYLHFFFHRLLTHRLVAVGHCALKRESSVGHIRYGSDKDGWEHNLLEREEEAIKGHVERPKGVFIKQSSRSSTCCRGTSAA